MEFKYKVIENCPDKYLKEDANDGYYYRITRNNPPKDEDFVPSYLSPKKYLKARKNNCLKNKDFFCLCLMCGLSVFRNKEEAINLLNRYPKLGEYIHGGFIKKEYGKLKASPSKERPSHHTWYPYKNITEKEIIVKLEYIKSEKNDKI